MHGKKWVERRNKKVAKKERNREANEGRGREREKARKEKGLLLVCLLLFAHQAHLPPQCSGMSLSPSVMIVISEWVEQRPTPHCYCSTRTTSSTFDIRVSAVLLRCFTATLCNHCSRTLVQLASSPLCSKASARWGRGKQGVPTIRQSDGGKARRRERNRNVKRDKQSTPES